MERKDYVVWLLCRNPACRKLFKVPRPFAPQHPFFTYEHAEEYARALKAGRVVELANETEAHMLANSLGRLKWLEKDLPNQVVCEHCNAVNPLKGIRHVVKEQPIETD